MLGSYSNWRGKDGVALTQWHNAHLAWVILQKYKIKFTKGLRGVWLSPAHGVWGMAEQEVVSWGSLVAAFQPQRLRNGLRWKPGAGLSQGPLHHSAASHRPCQLLFVESPFFLLSPSSSFSPSLPISPSLANGVSFSLLFRHSRRKLSPHSCSENHSTEEQFLPGWRVFPSWPHHARLCLPPAHTPHYWLLSVPWTWQAHSLLNGTATARLRLPWPLRLSVLRWWLHQFHLSLFSYHMNQTQQCWTTCKTGKFGWVSSYVLHWQEHANTKCIWRKLMLNQNRNSSKGSGF